MGRNAKADRRRREERREEILLAADALFARTGPVCAVEAVAKKLGLAKGTLYLYFPTKDELIGEVMKRAVARHLERLRAVANGEGNPADRLALMVRTSLAFVDEHRLVMRMMMETSVAQRAVVRRVWTRPARALFRDVLREGVRAGDFRAHDFDSISHCAMSLARGSLFYEGTLAFDAFAIEVSSLLVRGLAAGSARGSASVSNRRAARSSRSRKDPS